MTISIGGNSISLSDIKNTIANAVTKAASKILHKDLSGYTYDGGYSLIADFLTGDKVKMASDVTGLEVSDNDFVVKSSTGALTIENSRDKLIDFSDTYGNTGIYAYVAGNAGVVDGRNYRRRGKSIEQLNRGLRRVELVGRRRLFGGCFDGKLGH